MSEERSRPAYGEYATPEQVARARGMSLEEYERHLASLTRPRTTETTTDAASAGVAQPGATGAAPTPPRAQDPASVPQSSAAAGTPRAGGRSADRIVTIALLAFGLLSVLTSIPGLLGLGDGLALAFRTQGLDPFTSYGVARTIGIVAIVVQLLLWVLTLAISLAAMRRRRVSWWIPLLGGALAVLIVSALWLVAIFADPAFMQYITDVSVEA